MEACAGCLLGDELFIEVLEFLQTVVIFEQFFYCAILVVEQVLDRGTVSLPITAPEGAIQKSISILARLPKFKLYLTHQSLTSLNF